MNMTMTMNIHISYHSNHSKYVLNTIILLQSTKLHYVEAGSNSDPFVLLLHGFPDCWLGWHHQVSPIDAI